MEERNTKRKRMVSSPPKIESVTENTNKPSTKPSTSQSLLEIENLQLNGTAAAIGSSLLKIVDERGNGSKNRRSNNIILNEEIQKEERADKKEESIATKTNRVPPVVSAQPSALLSKLSAFLPQMHEANLQLEEKIQKNPIVAKREIEIDAVLDDEDDDDADDGEGKTREDKDEEGNPQIEMSLGMGVVDLKTVEAVEEVEKLVGFAATANGKSTNNEDEGKKEKTKKKKIEVL